jgi:hypothetical protein
MATKKLREEKNDWEISEFIIMVTGLSRKADYSMVDDIDHHVSMVKNKINPQLR